jgi:hypothetical protein
LHLIENCIYGIDIQTIAVQISKLRFFISLVSEQITNTDPKQNYGIIPLPNLETKFVAANTLIGLEKAFTDKLDLGYTDIRKLKDQLWEIRSKHFSARNANEKRDLRAKDEKLRNKIETLLVELTAKPDTDKIERLEKEIVNLLNLKESYHGENLVDIVEPSFTQGVLFEHQARKEQLTIRIDKNKEERKRVDKLIKEKKKEIEKEKSKTANSGFEKEAIQLAKWDPYDQNCSSHFFDSEWMFDINEGFDIVLGNPPYVQLQKNNGKLSKLFENSHYKTFERTGDIYSLFYEKGWQLLKERGMLCFITSNKWLRAGYGERTRKFFIENTNPLQLIDFAGQKVFDATVDTNILLFSKDKNRQQTLSCIIQENMLNNLSEYFRQNAIKSQFTDGKSWIVLSGIEQRIKRKVEIKGIALKDWNLDIYRGILTGYNEAFIIDGQKRKELISEDPKSVEIIRPILRGRDIKCYGFEFAGLYLINTFPALKIDIEQYPAIKKHLLEYFGLIGSTKFSLISAT